MTTDTKIETPVPVGTGDLFGNSAVNDALALVRVGARRRADPKEWMAAAAAVCGKCDGAEDVNEASSRILATELLSLRADVNDVCITLLDCVEDCEYYSDPKTANRLHEVVNVLRSYLPNTKGSRADSGE